MSTKEPESAVEQYHRPEWVAERLGVSIRFVYKLAAQLGGVRFGRSIRIPESGLRRYIEEQQKAGVR